MTSTPQRRTAPEAPWVASQLDPDSYAMPRARQRCMSARVPAQRPYLQIVPGLSHRIESRGNGRSSMVADGRDGLFAVDAESNLPNRPTVSGRSTKHRPHHHDPQRQPLSESRRLEADVRATLEALRRPGSAGLPPRHLGGTRRRRQRSAARHPRQGLQAAATACSAGSARRCYSFGLHARA